MAFLLYMGLFLPLLSFLGLICVSGKIGRSLTGYIACSAVLIPFLCFATLLWIYTHSTMDPTDFFLYHWIPVEGINADFTLHLDPLSLLMTLIITGVGFLIHLYSIGYIEHEEDYVRYFASLNFFIFAMLLLVLASNLLLLFVGWEGVGLASYLLIGFWYHRPAAAAAAKKAFIINRIGDAGLLIGLLLTFQIFGTSHMAEISERVGQMFLVGAPLLTVLTLLYFIGAVGKSAQIPLYVWLPDAMEGPTPVSALIHAATMVTAGVYLVVQMHALFLLAPTTLYIIGIIGAVTSLFAALCALAQTDLKRVLAYSTVSQLGLMFLACGAGAFYAAMFHLTTHAFVKALLFLSAGNIVHMMNGNTNMDRMGGLWSVFTSTRWLFLIGVLALAGMPPFSIFFSKDLILEQENEAGFEVLFYIGLLTSLLTAFYVTRAYCLTFMGAPRLQGKMFSMIKEAPKIMTYPLFLLALLSIFGGALGFAFDNMPLLETFLAEVGVGLVENEPSGNYIYTTETLVAVVGASLGLLLAAVLYIFYPNKLGKPVVLLKKAFFVDELYDLCFVRPLRFLGGIVVYIIEPKVIEGSLIGIAKGIKLSAAFCQKMQSGQIRSYVAWMALGMSVMVFFLCFYV